MVFIEKNRKFGGKRCVTRVREVSGFSGGRVDGADIFVPSALDGRAVRSQAAIRRSEGNWKTPATTTRRRRGRRSGTTPVGSTEPDNGRHIRCLRIWEGSAMGVT